MKALVDSGCTHTGIDEQMVKDKRIQTKPINFSFKVFNADGMKNGEVTKVVPLEIEINGHKETLEAAVMDLDGTDMFLGHNWLVKHNPEVNWTNGTIKFTRCPGNCTMKYEDIQFKSRRTKATETTDNKEQDNGEIGKEPDYHMQVHLSGKLHPRGDANSEPYKPAFHGGHLSRNTSYGSAATLWVFRLPWRRYSYSTQSSMTELLLSVSQH